MATDPFSTYEPSLNSDGIDAFAVTPSDTVDFTTVARRLYIGVTGDVTLVTKGGNAVLFKAVPVGELRVGALRVNSTGTTATNIVGIV